MRGWSARKHRKMVGLVTMLALIILSALALSFCNGDTRQAHISAEALRNITLACSITRHRELCHEYVVSSGAAAEAASQPVEFVKLAMQIAMEGVTTSLNLAGDPRNARKPMRLFLEDSVTLLGQSRELLTRSQSENFWANESLSNVHHWLSAALTYNTDCHEFLRNYSVHLPLLTSHLEGKGIPLLSNALTVVAALSKNGYNFNVWQPPSVSMENGNVSQLADKVFEPMVVSSEFNESLTLSMASAIVSKNSRYGSHFTIQSAVNDAPDNSPAWNRHVIFISEGIYEEQVVVPITKTFIVFMGAGINRTIITGNLSVAMNMTTYRTATLAIEGNGFLARDLTVVNTAGPDSQAVAVRVDSDMAAFHRCSFWGYQDTLYTHAYRQFYRECHIYGTVDFIFGNAASVFQNCEIQIRPSFGNHVTSAISAQGRTDPAQATAFVCQSCIIRGTPEFMQLFTMNPALQVYLGRPWRTYARSIFIESYMDEIIDASGWMPWDATAPQDELLVTTVLAEYRSSGPGGSPLLRVSWSKQMNTFTAFQFTVRELIQGGFWLPFTGIPYRLSF